MKLSNQALGAIMLALQKSLMEQSDIVPVLLGFDFEDTEQGLTVLNPPVVNFDNLSVEEESEDEVDEQMELFKK